MKTLFTSESVTCGHPDKISDTISDTLLDAYLNQDPDSRVAIETLVTNNNVIVAGEVTSKATLTKDDINNIIKATVEDIGYTYPDMQFNSEKLNVTQLIHSQSPDISQGVDINGAGDQGIMFGGACRGIDDETLMPDCWRLAKLLSDILYRTGSKVPGIRPDGKTQVTLDYSGDKPKWDTVVISVQHDPDVKLENLRKLIITSILSPVILYYQNKIEFEASSFKLLINPTGRFVIGGPDGDTGLTGRKIVVDNYGGYYPVGGGAFSGKDATKVDRSAAYMARYIAYNIVSNKIGNDCEVQLSYSIGVPDPTSIRIKLDGVVRDDLSDWFMKNVKMDPKSIIDKFDLRRTKKLFSYSDLAAKGHFGRFDIKLPWETADLDLSSFKK